MRINYVILTCGKNYLKRKINIDWLKGANQTITLLSDKHLEGAEEYNQFYVEEDTNGVNIGKRYAYFFKNYFQFEEFDYFVFLDDDTLFNYKNLTQEILDKTQEGVLGKLLRLHADGRDAEGNQTGYPFYLLPFYSQIQFPIVHMSGGAGFILNRESFKVIQNYLNNFSFYIFPHTDVSLSYWLFAAKLKLISLPGLNSANYRTYDFSEKQIQEQLSFHYMGAEDSPHVIKLWSYE